MLQETWLFSGSIKENIQLGFVQYDDEHILKISKIAGVDDFVSQHPSGYDLQLKEKGEDRLLLSSSTGSLSTGEKPQKQRQRFSLNAESLDSSYDFAVIECSKSKMLEKKYNFPAYPMFFFFMGGRIVFAGTRFHRFGTGQDDFYVHLEQQKQWFHENAKHVVAMYSTEWSLFTSYGYRTPSLFWYSMQKGQEL